MRLNAVYDFVRKGDYDIYVNPRKLIRKLPLIKPDLTKGGAICLPLIYDIAGWAAYLPKCGTKEELAKADTIIHYIFHEEYQNFPWGYGIMANGTGRTWSMGWSVHLPAFIGSPARKYVNKSPVHMMSLLINYKAARKHSWLRKCIVHLEEFRTDKGIYLFPLDYLQEKTVAYWVSGVRMGLDGGRRTERALELESTFWMAKFHKQLSSSA